MSSSEDPVNILLVDDRPEQLLVLESILSELRQNTVRAASGCEALRFLLSHECALILLDVNMPDIDGFETASLIRQRPRSRQIPIIFVTAHDETETHVSRGYSLGAVDYIHTPVLPEVLLAKASVFVELARHARLARRQAEQLELRVQERTAELQTVNAALQAEMMEREQAAEERDRLLAEAQEGVRRRDEFLAMLAHELRNPLASIVSAAEVLQIGNLPEEAHLQAREVVDRQARHMTRLLQELLDISRITRDKVDLDLRPADLRPLVAKLVEEKRNDMLLEHVVSLSLPAEPVRVNVDPDRLLQVLTNLLGNAAKFTAAGERVSVSVGAEAGHAVIRVSDTGIGIAPEMLSQIFEPFVQLNRSHARPSEGLGIGLTLVRRLVEMHGGRVCARSSGFNCGSEFVVELPLHAGLIDSAPSRDSPSPRALVDSVRCARRIVLVEDNHDSRQLLCRLLRLGGHHVEASSDGPGGVASIRQLRPDFALIDIGLPGFDGYRVAEQVRADPACREVRLIALTGYGQPEDRRRALAAGFDDHLVKPVRVDELARLLANGAVGLAADPEFASRVHKAS